MTAYNYGPSKAYCTWLGLHWLGDNFVDPFGQEALSFGFTQMQFDVAMRNHLWVVRYLFTPQTYTRWQRLKIAAWFLFGRWKKA